MTIDKLRAGERAGMVTVADMTAVLFISHSGDSLRVERSTFGTQCLAL